MYFTPLASAIKGNALLVECSLEETLLRRIGLGCLKSIISGVRKKSRVRASVSSLVEIPVNWTIVRSKTGRFQAGSGEILHETFWKQRYILTYLLKQLPNARHAWGENLETNGRFGIMVTPSSWKLWKIIVWPMANDALFIICLANDFK